ncbi:4-hydroxy-tetrahydrodipicolinate reductase [Falsiporphyromonas endometrii]|uniref:4-hydroxy-tetrahydrodipicolinate reductase n=1 Tax=Falsiporphyromonas endometrii TaxID=1387297 RepID=A0ABV9K5Y7_9PORP
MNIALIGYGRMGHAIEKIALSRGHKIVLTIDKGEDDKFKSPIWKEVDAAIEFTGPSSAESNCRQILNMGIPLVCGSTGFMTPELMSEFMILCKKGATFFYATNFSVGVNILFALNQRLASLMTHQDEYKAQVEETHHIHKLDKPSGTAVTLLSDLIKFNHRYKDWSLVDNTDNDFNKLSIDTIPVKAYREGEVFGIHQVSYTSSVDTISIRHEAFSRDGFATGAVLAAEYTKDNNGLLTMADLLGI